MKTIRLFSGFALALLLHPSPARADDWPQWMGPQRDGVWRETGIVEKLPPQRPDDDGNLFRLHEQTTHRVVRHNSRCVAAQSFAESPVRR